MAGPAAAAAQALAASLCVLGAGAAIRGRARAALFTRIVVSDANLASGDFELGKWVARLLYSCAEPVDACTATYELGFALVCSCRDQLGFYSGGAAALTPAGCGSGSSNVRRACTVLVSADPVDAGCRAALPDHSNARGGVGGRLWRACRAPALAAARYGAIGGLADRAGGLPPADSNQCQTSQALDGAGKRDRATG